MTHARTSPRLWPTLLALAPLTATLGMIEIALLYPVALLFGLDAGFAYQRCMAT